MDTTINDSSAELSVISKQIRVLESRVDELSGKVAYLEGHTDLVVDSGREEGDSLVPMETSGSLGEWISKGALLQKMAIICFILVFALLLRTVTDYGYVNAMAGSFLGLVYVSILAVVGCVFYVTGKQMANVFSISGFLLLFSIVFESYGRFDTIPIGVAYAILMTALLTSTAVGIKYRVTKLLSVSLIGVTISGLAIGFPQVHFPLSGLLFFTANMMAIFAAKRLDNGKLKWPVTMLTLLFWAIWAFKAHVPLGRGETVPEYVYVDWLAPLLGCFVALYFITYLKRYFSEGRLTVYDAVIPSLNMLLLFLAGSVVLRDYWQQSWLLGLLALTMGFVHFAMGWRLSIKDRNRFVGVGGAFVAGSIMLALGVPVVVGNVAWAIACWSLLAYGLARLSGRCNNGGIRLVSYLYPVFALWTGLALGVFETGKAVGPYAPLTAAAALALFGMILYHWCRHNPPPTESLFAKLDSRDYSAVAHLVICLAGFYLLFSMTIDLIASMVLVDPANTIKCGRSIIINVAATFLLVMGGRRHDLELIWLAVFLAVIGCLKVFLVDLFGTSGIPLVLSVLSFGVVAMAGSIVMGRWNKLVKD
ncbi:MAG: hypothetical protein ABFS18_00090 [Thermodesulfobacteriota bacterium]